LWKIRKMGEKADKKVGEREKTRRKEQTRTKEGNGEGKKDDRKE